MRSLFDLEEANIILSALSDMDDFFLPKSISRKALYMLARKLTDAIGSKPRVDSEIQLPNLFHDKFDTTKLVEIDLTQVEMDYVICALHSLNSEGTGYPQNINLAVSRAYNKVNAQFIDCSADSSEEEIWEIVVQNNDPADSEA